MVYLVSTDDGIKSRTLTAHLGTSKWGGKAEHVFCLDQGDGKWHSAGLGESLMSPQPPPEEGIFSLMGWLHERKFQSLRHMKWQDTVVRVAFAMYQALRQVPSHVSEAGTDGHNLSVFVLVSRGLKSPFLSLIQVCHPVSDTRVCTYIRMCACMLNHLSHVRFFETPWTVAFQAPLSVCTP